MKNMVRLPWLAALLMTAPLLLSAQPSCAQMPGGGIGPVGTASAARPTDDTPAPPPALPGAVPDASDSSSTASIDTQDPTKALFLAINQGDYGAARVAIGRGADLNARNALGETPLDLSIDLNHSAITFLLLSERGADQPAPVAGLAGNTAKITQAAAGPAKLTRHAAPYRPAMPTSPVRAPIAATPGTPDPQAGFLGFGSK
ncbi:MAG TPA: ankyrin repeat domain-containing protein [Acetobacteraceae bacterium]|nr:ankyrin repeat domain-containing protein [Acetobacteraceae bacterium]HQU00854.1 ankyrin repeat domain-containing protein [Acetobacteraceae bacterium]